jgi:hypothetical protein
VEGISQIAQNWWVNRLTLVCVGCIIPIILTNQATHTPARQTMTTIKTTAEKFFNNLDSGKWQIVYTIEVCERYEVLNTRNGKSYIVILQ